MKHARRDISWRINGGRGQPRAIGYRRFVAGCDSPETMHLEVPFFGETGFDAEFYR